MASPRPLEDDWSSRSPASEAASSRILSRTHERHEYNFPILDLPPTSDQDDMILYGFHMILYGSHMIV